MLGFCGFHFKFYELCERCFHIYVVGVDSMARKQKVQ